MIATDVNLSSSPVVETQATTSNTDSSTSTITNIVSVFEGAAAPLNSRGFIYTLLIVLSSVML